MLDLLPTSRSAVGYWHDNTNYVVHPDVSFTLDLAGGIPSLLPGIRAPRHHAPAGARPAGELSPLLPERLRPSGSRRGSGPWRCSSSRTPHDEDAFLDAAAGVDHAPFASSNLETIGRRGILADTWLLPEPDTGESLTLQQLDKVQLFQTSGSRGFL